MLQSDRNRKGQWPGAYAYLQRIFKELPGTQNLEDIEALLPWNFDPESLAAV